MALPRYVAFQSKYRYNKKYLRYRHEEGEFRGFLQFSGDEVVSPYTKYEVERAKSGERLVHLRCCYSNNYWAQLSSHDVWIVARTGESEEDQSQWSCTLFEPIYDANHQAYRFRHVNSGNYVVLWRDDYPTDNCLLAKYNEPDRDLCDLMTIVDCESLLALPKYVAFKGDNNCYLRAAYQERHEYLEFSGNDVGDPNVGNEVFINSDGSIRIKSYHYEKFWRRSPNWIWADSADTSSSDRDTLFWPVKVDDNIVALRNLGNNYFCKRLTTEGKTSCLNAATPTISNEARLTVEELVLSREIYNLEFRVSDARIFDQRILTVAYDDVVNHGSEKSDMDVSLSFTDTETNTWSSTFSMKLGVKTTINTGIPKIAKGQIEISAEFSGSYTWGGTKTSEHKISRTFKVAVPKKTEVKVSMIATKGRCNVPFSYTQRDTLIDGRQVVTHLDDGIFTGANCYNFQYEVDETPLQFQSMFA